MYTESTRRLSVRSPNRMFIYSLLSRSLDSSVALSNAYDDRSRGRRAHQRWCVMVGSSSAELLNCVYRGYRPRGPSQKGPFNIEKGKINTISHVPGSPAKLSRTRIMPLTKGVFNIVTRKHQLTMWDWSQKDRYH
jgi:hypothetical protein